MALNQNIINSPVVPKIPNVWYADPTDIIRRLSVEGVKLRVEDYGDGAVYGEQGAIEDCIWDASETINFFCFQHYAPTDLARSTWINRRATDIAVYLLSCRRGNTPSQSMENRYKESLQWLQLVHSSVYDVPGVPTRFSLAPSYSNVRIDQRYKTFRIRVERPISESTPVLFSQSIDFSSEYEINI